MHVCRVHMCICKYMYSVHIYTCIVRGNVHVKFTTKFSKFRLIGTCQAVFDERGLFRICTSAALLGSSCQKFSKVIGFRHRLVPQELKNITTVRTFENF